MTQYLLGAINYFNFPAFVKQNAEFGSATQHVVSRIEVESEEENILTLGFFYLTHACYMQNKRETKKKIFCTF